MNAVRTRNKLKPATLLFLIIPFGLCGFSPLLAQPWKATLDSCLLWARENMPIAQQDELSRQALEHQIKALNTAYLPRLEIGAFGGYVEGIPAFGHEENISAFRFAGALTLKQTLWDGGKTQREKEIARTKSRIEEEDHQARMREIQAEAGNAFFSLLLLQEQEALLSRQESLLKESRDIARTAVRNGAGLQSDIDQVELALLELEQQKAGISSAKDACAKILGMMTGKDMEEAVLEEPMLSPNPQTGIENQPEWAMFELQKKLLDNNAGGIGQFLPKVDVVGSGIYAAPRVQFSNSSWNHLLAAGLSLSWSIGSEIYAIGHGKKRLSVEKQKIENLQQSYFQQSLMELESSKSLIAKWDTLLEKDKAIVDLHAKIRENAQTRYDNGALEMEKLLEALRKESQAIAQASLHRIERMAEIFRYNLKAGTGTPVL